MPKETKRRQSGTPEHHGFNWSSTGSVLHPPQLVSELSPSIGTTASFPRISKVPLDNEPGGRRKGWLSPLSFPLLISYGVFSISSQLHRFIGMASDLSFTTTISSHWIRSAREGLLGRQTLSKHWHGLPAG